VFVAEQYADELCGWNLTRNSPQPARLINISMALQSLMKQMKRMKRMKRMKKMMVKPGRGPLRT
jgi:hypothetical protein